MPITNAQLLSKPFIPLDSDEDELMFFIPSLPNFL